MSDRVPLQYDRHGRPTLYGPDGQPISRNGNGFARDGYGDFPLPHALTFASVFSGADRTYFSQRWDEAIKHAREDALVMRRDAWLMSLLRERKDAVLGTSWHLEVPNEKDPTQTAVRDALQTAIRETWDLDGLLSAKLEALWYGRAAVEVIWERKPGQPMKVVDWFPVLGDKLNWQFDGTPCVLIHAGEVRESEYAEIITTDLGRALRLNHYWRPRFLIHRAEGDDSDYLDGESAASIWGVGIRHRIFWLDWLRREYMEWGATFLERVGLGMTVWLYDASNPSAKREAETAAKTNSRRANLIVPVWPDGKGSVRGGVERIETPVAGIEALREMITHIEDQIERFIVGQEASSSGKGSGGLGNQAGAEFQQATKAAIRDRDCKRLAQFLTGNERHPNLVYLMQRWSFPQTLQGPNAFRCRFVFDLEDEESKERLDAARTLFDMGVSLKANEVRAAAGFSKPTAGDEVIAGPQQDPAQALLGGMGGNGQSSQFGGKPNDGDPKGGPPQHFARDNQALLYAARHAPSGGVTIAGKTFRGGEFIPREVLARATPEEKAALQQGHRQDRRQKVRARLAQRRQRAYAKSAEAAQQRADAALKAAEDRPAVRNQVALLGNLYAVVAGLGNRRQVKAVLDVRSAYRRALEAARQDVHQALAPVREQVSAKYPPKIARALMVSVAEAGREMASLLAQHVRDAADQARRSVSDSRADVLDQLREHLQDLAKPGVLADAFRDSFGTDPESWSDRAGDRLSPVWPDTGNDEADSDAAGLAMEEVRRWAEAVFLDSAERQALAASDALSAQLAARQKTPGQQPAPAQYERNKKPETGKDGGYWITVGGQADAPEGDEEAVPFARDDDPDRYAWTRHRGPKGGQGWRDSQTGDIRYGDRPSGRQRKLALKKRRRYALALAKWYAEHWNALGELGYPVPKDELVSAGHELLGSGVALWKDTEGTGKWRAVRLAYPQMGGPILYAQERAPRGGITIAGKRYAGGQWVPSAAVEKATPEQRAELRKAHESAQAKRRGRGSVDEAGLREALREHAGHDLDRAELQLARRAYRGLKQYHGDLTLHRLEELIHDTQEVLASVPDDHPNAEGLREHFGRRLRAYAHMLDWAKEHGLTGKVAEEKPETAAPGKAARAEADRLKAQLEGSEEVRAEDQPVLPPTPAPALPQKPTSLADAYREREQAGYHSRGMSPGSWDTNLIGRGAERVAHLASAGEAKDDATAPPPVPSLADRVADVLRRVDWDYHQHDDGRRYDAGKREADAALAELRKLPEPEARRVWAEHGPKGRRFPFDPDPAARIVRPFSPPVPAGRARLTGRTYEHRDIIRNRFRGSWDPATKSWLVPLELADRINLPGVRVERGDKGDFARGDEPDRYAWEDKGPASDGRRRKWRDTETGEWRVQVSEPGTASRRALPASPPEQPGVGEPATAGGLTEPDISPEGHRQRLARVQARAREALDVSGLPRETREAYAAAFNNVLGRLTPTALALHEAHTREYRFFATHEDLHAAYVRDYPQAARRPGRIIRGAFSPDGVLYLNGGGAIGGLPATLEQFIAHEVSHTIDGREHAISRSREWVEAWEAEIADGAYLGRNSARSPTEGFSDFGQMVLGSKISRRSIRQVMPKSLAVWESHGL